MIVTLTSKGQLTLPKAIRDRLRLDAGSKLDFQVQPDGTLAARPLNRSVESLFGMLHRPGTKAVSVQEMNESVGDALAERNDRVRSPAGKPRKRTR